MNIFEEEITTACIDLTDNESKSLEMASQTFRALANKYSGHTFTATGNYDVFFTAEELWTTAQILREFVDCPTWRID